MSLIAPSCFPGKSGIKQRRKTDFFQESWADKYTVGHIVSRLPWNKQTALPCAQRMKCRANCFVEGQWAHAFLPTSRQTRSPWLQTLPVARSDSKPADASLQSCKARLTVIWYLLQKETGRCPRLILCLFNLLIYHLWDMIANPLQSKVTENHSSLTALKDHK